MKKFLTKKWHGIPIAVIVSALVTALTVSGLFAAGTFTKTVPATIEVRALPTTEPGLGVYSDINCTVEVTSFPVGSIEVGQTVSLPKVWVKNIGNQPFTSLTITTDLDPGIATMQVAGWPRGLTNPGDKWDANITFTGMSASSGSQSFNIMFNGNY